MRSNDIPALICELRRRLDLTQERFAQKVGVTYSNVSLWQNGKRVPPPFLVKRLVEMKEELDSRTKSPLERECPNESEGPTVTAKEGSNLAPSDVVSDLKCSELVDIHPVRPSAARRKSKEWGFGLAGW
ncbi:MAG TPA: helix-turn-helix domain-containing protein [Acidobacteriota bacterium]|nr:helix-turn-helix domain-containing protein [Acidobacteriota bacterium]